MEKEIVTILISNRAIRMGDLFGEAVGLGLKGKYKTFPSLVEALDGLLYILNKLEEEGYIKQKHIVNSTKITANKLHWFVSHIKEIYCWEITTESGLLEYIRNNYRTHDEIVWERTRNLSVAVAIIAAILTSLLTALFTSPPIVNCFGL